MLLGSCRFDLISTFFISVGNGLEVPSSQPVVMAALVANGFRKFSGVDPTVDVHVHVELFRSMSENESENATKRVCFSVAHDEFPFVVAHRAVGARKVSMGSALA